MTHPDLHSCRREAVADRGRRRRTGAVLAGAAVVAAGAAAAVASPASATASPTVAAQSSHVAPPATPVRGAAGAAAWLARQFKGPFIPSSTSATTPDYSDTEQSVLALVASRAHAPTVRAAVAFLERHVAAEITARVGGRVVGDPGAIALLILDARATGRPARDFGGVNLVDRLLATMRPSGPNAGLFGAAPPTYDGAYRQGLSLAALAGAGAAPARVAPAVRWLERQQCTSGGWEAYRAVTTEACPAPDPAAYRGPDSNSTALAVEGLRAEHAVLRHPAFRFLVSRQDRDGGWGYYGGPSDPDSTAVVRQALVALGRAHSRPIVKAGGTPLTALLHFQLISGPNAGAFAYPGAPGANLLATEQAVPALAGLAFPLADASS